ncbi:prostaglandin E synthase 3 isoform X2 [Trachypithecus francoisi]|uniref:prostaglandin E synthase 3 isoform X2 n=1 Tax=Trachypithecus francoisi TaxID=54180 RepID=UPI00141AE86C|nr:prostaglandin E synthase 3 isoform X2 [Trachypithecus francoisi]
MQPASAKWYDRRDYVFIEFCVEDSKDVNVNFEKSKLTFSCLGGSDNFKHLNEIDLFHCIDPNDSKHKRTDRSILCCLRKGESGQSWPRLTKERAKMMNNMGGDEDVDLPEVDGADDVSLKVFFLFTFILLNSKQNIYKWFYIDSGLLLIF